MSWVGERIRKNAKSVQKEYRQMYFRYESISDVESKIKEEGMLSGLATMKDDTEMLEDQVWIVYWKNGSTVSIVPLINVGKLEEQ